MTPASGDLVALLERVKNSRKFSNELDVEIEVAIFKPDAWYASVRPNSAGTKVIYTDHSGEDHTYRAFDWALSPADRDRVIAHLQSLISTQATS